MQPITFNEMPEALMEIGRKVDYILSQLPKKIEPDQDKLMTIEELQSYVPGNPAKQTIYGWINNRQIPYEKYGRRCWFRKSKIDQWLNNGRRIN